MGTSARDKISQLRAKLIATRPYQKPKKVCATDDKYLSHLFSYHTYREKVDINIKVDILSNIILKIWTIFWPPLKRFT